jgi:hypothetical protein
MMNDEWEAERLQVTRGWGIHHSSIRIHHYHFFLPPACYSPTPGLRAGSSRPRRASGPPRGRRATGPNAPCPPRRAAPRTTGRSTRTTRRRKGGRRKRGQVHFVLSTLRAVPAKCPCPLLNHASFWIGWAIPTWIVADC